MRVQATARLWRVLLIGLLTACTVPNAPSPSYPNATNNRVWIDTDAACLSADMFADPDDCLALVFADRLTLNVAGISLTQGNAAMGDVRESVVALGLASDTPVLDGGTASCDSPAVRGLAKATANQKLDILALGPLTNIAAFARCYPDHVRNVRQVIAVMGRRPGQVFRRPDGMMILRDMNFENDPLAARAVKTAFPMRYIPYEAGIEVQVPARHLASVCPRDVRSHVFQWSLLVRAFWGTDAMPQFDLTATTAFAWPDMFDCRPVHTRIMADRLVAFPSPGTKTEESYCTPKNNEQLVRLLFGERALAAVD